MLDFEISKYLSPENLKQSVKYNGFIIFSNGHLLCRFMKNLKEIWKHLGYAENIKWERETMENPVFMIF